MATKGIWIPIDIMLDSKLNQSQKFILSEIHQLVQLDKGCFASNNHFSSLIGISKENVSRNINLLIGKGYIESKIIDGSRNHNRIITLTTLVSPPYQNSKTPLLKRQETIDNNPIKKPITKPVATAQDEKINIEFEDLWSQYREILKKSRKNSDVKEVCLKKYTGCFVGIKKTYKNADDDFIFDFIFDYISEDWLPNDKDEYYITKLKTRLDLKEMLTAIEEDIKNGG